jgi:hypothetical protein
MTVVAVDPIGGEGRLPAAFSYDADAGAGGLPADAGCPAALGITP